MPIFTSKDEIKSGLPLGGIGAGKFEILPSGLFNAFTLQNNWSKPILGENGYPGILGYHLGITVEKLDASGQTISKQVALLQTVPVLNIPTVSHIRYQGIFPKVTLEYELKHLGLTASLHAFSSLVPGDIKNSSLPATFFELKFQNKNPYPIKLGFIFIGRNISGKWCVGRKNRIHSDKKLVTLEFSNEDPTVRDVRQGSLSFTFLKKGWNTSFMESWNAVTQNFSFNSKNILLAGWDYFVKESTLPDSQPKIIAQGENQELCGAVAMTKILAPNQTVDAHFNATWHFPHHPFGHRYHEWFKSPKDVARYAISQKDNLQNKVEAFHKLVLSLPFPEWFNTALLTSLAPFFVSSWLVKNGRFAFYEAPVICPLMGTIDVGFYGSIPLAFFFPELEKSQLMLFAKSQRPNGYIPHDLGKNRIDLPSNGTTFYFWKDLNPKFVLMAYRDFLWSKDEKFLKQIYPHAKKAIQWSLKTDYDGNGLPDNEGADHTFDLWHTPGTHPYTSGIFLAALLAMQKMAHLSKDARFEKDCQNYFAKGSYSFEKELWNGEYFGDFSTLSQLNGQWYASLLDLGFISDEVRTKKAARHILTHHPKHSSFGMVNSTTRDRALDESNHHAKNIWFGMNYAFASLALMLDFPQNKVLKEIHKLWDNAASNQKNPWNQPDMIDSKTGEFLFGDSYYRNMAIWSIPIARGMRDAKVKNILTALKTIGSK